MMMTEEKEEKEELRCLKSFKWDTENEKKSNDDDDDDMMMMMTTMKRLRE